jgi:ABC-type multidrug transport system permease subunit
VNVERLNYKSFDELLMAPINHSSIVIGKALLGVIRGLLSCSAILLLGLLLTPDLHPNLMFFISLVTSCLAFSFLGIYAAFVVNSHQNMSTFNSMVMLPMTFLCGTFFSLDQIPSFLSAVLYLLPLTHASEIIRAAALDNSYPWASLLILIAFGAFFYLASLRVLRRTSV